MTGGRAAGVELLVGRDFAHGEIGVAATDLLILVLKVVLVAEHAI